MATLKKRDDSKHYNGCGTLGRDPAVIMVCGQRRRGKSTWWLKWAVEQYEKKEEMFIWVRRFSSELSGGNKRGEKNLGCMNNFGAGVNALWGKEIHVDKNDIWLSTKNRDRKIGTFACLALSGNTKGITVAANEKYRNTIFDEFLIDTPTYHYLQGDNEPLELLKIVDSYCSPGAADNDIGKIVLLANAVKFANPYFLFWNIPPFKGKYYYNEENDVLVEMDADPVFTEARKKTRFGRVVAGTMYSDYAIENKFLMDDEKFLERRPVWAIYQFALRYRNKNMAVWYDRKNGKIYIDNDADERRAMYCITRDDMSINTLLIRRIPRSPIDLLLTAFDIGQMFFSDPIIKSFMLEVLAYFTRK